MPFILPLTQEDINLLVSSKEDTQTLNQSIQESNVTISSEIAKLLLIDVPFKKQLDPVHVDIFEFEEELRRLNGMSIIQPLQEAGFTISNTSGNPARLSINDGRMIITENDIEILNIPLFPVRGFSKSQQCGLNFDIWSRDRLGSTTSSKHSTNLFSIDGGNRKLAVRFDESLDVEIDISSIINIFQEGEVVFAITTGTETNAILNYSPIIVNSETVIMSGEEVFPLERNIDYTINYTTGEITFLNSLVVDYELSVDYENQVILEASALASTIQVLLQQSHSSLQNVSCVFNEEIMTFTIVSNHGGPTSTVEVIPASEYDLMGILGFSDQYMIQGKYQNNLLNVEIDGQAAEIKISDFRLCFEDTERGYNNDDIGFSWSGSLSSPLGYVGYDKLGPLFCSGLNNGKDVAKSIEAQLRIVGSGGFKNATVHYFTDEEVFVIYSGTMGLYSSVHVLPASDVNRDASGLVGFSTPQEERGNEEYYETLQKLYDKINSITNMIAYNLTEPSRLSHSILYTKSNGVNIHSDFQDFDATTTKIYDDASRGLPRLYPNGKLVVDYTNDKICFIEVLNTEKIATVPHGVYDNESFLAEGITYSLNIAGASTDYNCTYNFQAKKFTISKGSGNFSLLWQTGANAITSIGCYLGYDVTIDKTGSGSYISDFQVTFQMQDFFNPAFPNQFDGTGVSLPLVPDYTVDEKSAIIKEEEYLNDENTNSFLLRMNTATTYDNEIIVDTWEQLVSLELAKVNQQYNAIRYHRGAYANHISETDAIITTKTIAYNNLLPNRTNLVGSLAHHNVILNVIPMIEEYVAEADFSNGSLDQLVLSISSGSYDRRIYNNPAPLVINNVETKHIPGRFDNTGLMTTSVIYTPESRSAFRIQRTQPNTNGYSYSHSDSDGYNILYSSNTLASIIGNNIGPFNMSSGNVLELSVDGGLTQIATFDATSGYTESRLSTIDSFLVKSGVNDKLDFCETIGAEFTITIPEGNYTGATLANEIATLLNSTGSSFYECYYNSVLPKRFAFFSDGAGGSGIFNLLLLSGTNSSTSISYTLGFNNVDKTGSLTYFSDNQTSFPVLSNLNDTFSIRINGIDSSLPIVLNQGNYASYTDLISEMTTKISNDINFDISDFTITYPSNKFRITSTMLGIGSTIEVFEGTNDFLRTITMDGDVPVVGGGDVADISAVTTNEVANVLNSEISGISASNDGNKIRISTISEKGSVSSIEIIGGTCRIVLGLDITTVFGQDQNNKLKVDIDFNELEDPIEVITGTGILGQTMASSIQTQLRAIGSSGYSNSICTFNETTAFQVFVDSLRIISGTYGLSSYVNVSDKTIKITSSNNKIDFNEGLGELTCVLSEGFYNSSTLCSEIKTQLELIGTNIYQVSYMSNKVTINTDYNFSLLFGSGSNNLQSVCNTIGFYNIDYSGNSTYTGIGYIKTCSCITELGFNLQTIEPGHSLDLTNLTITDSNVISTIHWLDNGGGSRIDFNIDITLSPFNIIQGLIEEIFSYDTYTITYSPAFLLGRIPSKFRIEHNDSLIVNVNGGPDNMITIDAVNASSVSGVDPCTRIFSGVNDRLRLIFNGLPYYEIVIGTQMTPESIASKIQQEVRSIFHSDIEIQSTFSRFTCEYLSGRYFLSTGNSGTSSTLSVVNYSAAPSLKLGVANGGVETPGTGDVSNNNFATASELVAKFSSLTDINVSGTDYIKISSNVSGDSTRIQLEGELASKLGFDTGWNDDSYPATDLSSANSSSLLNIVDQDILSSYYDAVRGWDVSKGNVRIVFSTCDKQKIVERLPIISNRLSFIPGRKMQITNRSIDVLSELTYSVYDSRKEKVLIRLNKKTGSYVKIGEKLNQQENNESSIDVNNDFIATIDSILS
ncbi:MAG: hypothetical protein PHF86_04725 [Candidatus Nanoarchaeia archaeon]|nr:hypothetical protein [Candidatus Nanoarchaeia archaeon]